MASKTITEVEEEIEEFLLEDASSLNQTQRVILIAENFDFMVLTTAEWLSEKYGLDIRCYRLRLSADGDGEFLSCTCIYPPPKLTENAVRRGRRGELKPLKWFDWDAALEAVSNAAVVDFFRRRLESGQENYLQQAHTLFSHRR